MMGRKEAFEKYKDSMDQDVLNDILDLACDKTQEVCPRFNPKSYCNTKIKSLHMIMKGKGKYSDEEREAFNLRLEKIKNKSVGETFCISDIRDKGTRGTYEREACAYLICRGILKKKIIYSEKDKNKEKPIIIYERIDAQACPYTRIDCVSTANFCECEKFIEKKIWVNDYDYDGFASTKK